MSKEVSKKIVAIVLILAIIVSAYLTLMLLKNKAILSEEQKVRNTIQSAEVSLTVVPGPVEEPEGDVSAEEGEWDSND